jgi:hypothetical protein
MPGSVVDALVQKQPESSPTVSSVPSEIIAELAPSELLAAARSCASIWSRPRRRMRQKLARGGSASGRYAPPCSAWAPTH